MDTTKTIKELEKRKKLSPIERILAVTDGSVTALLEAYTCGPVRIKTISQEVKEAGKLAKDLDVGEKDSVNFREVEIVDKDGRPLIYAKSFVPLKRLKPAFREDMMKADVPIGKLLEKHKIEARRELINAWIEENKVKRTYSIVSGNGTLMRIEEKFELVS